MGKLAQSCFGLGILLIAYGVNFSAAYAQESPKQIGYYCGSDTASITEGQYYIPGGSCTYLTHSLSGYRYGDIFRGTVGSSTIITGHGLEFNGTSSPQYGDIVPNPVQGEDLFVAAYEVPGGMSSYVFAMRRYLTGAASDPPAGINYGIIRFKYGVVPPNDPDPVIIIPGILGSEQYKGEWVMDPILHTYDDLIATLDVNGYTPDSDLFTFPYNWRKSNVETAILLKEKINAVKEICECEKVDLVAHSMGGLVARQYIQSDAYENDVNQLIFLGTPHLGAPKAYLMWEGGEISSSFSVVDEITELMLEHEGYEKRYPTLFAYVRTDPIESVRELLPTYGYIYDTLELREYPDGYPRNTFLENLNSNVGILDSRVDVHNILGVTNGPQTIVGLTVTDEHSYLPMWQHGYPVGFFDWLGDKGLVLGDGDGTVPLSSAAFVSTNVVQVPYGHNDLPIEAQNDVFKVLRGQDAEVVIKNGSNVNKRLILIKILSPIDVLVEAPDGKRIGKDANGSEINQIPGAFYSGFETDTEFITIPNPLDGEYKIVTEGTGEGSYIIEVDYISEATSTAISFTGSTNPGFMTGLLFNMDTNEPEQMEIVPEDQEPPRIVITSPGARDYLRSETLGVDVVAEDDTGVFWLQTQLGTTTVQNDDTIDLFFQKLGVHTLTASSSDFVGNATSTTLTFRIVATTESTLSDIERAYALGWMTDENKKHLINKIEKALSVEENMRQLNPDKDHYQKRLQNLREKFANVLSTDFMRELNKQRSRGLSERAYEVLEEDVNWLMANNI